MEESELAGSQRRRALGFSIFLYSGCALEFGSHKAIRLFVQLIPRFAFPWGFWSICVPMAHAMSEWFRSIGTEAWFIPR